METDLKTSQFHSRTASQSTSKSRSSSRQRNPYRSASTAAYISYPVSHVMSSLYRRVTDSSWNNDAPSIPSINPRDSSNGNGAIYTPPRHESPFQPPALSALKLRVQGRESLSQSSQILTRSLAEEIRLLLPPRLQLMSDWSLAYSLDRDGATLSTLYKKCETWTGGGHGFVLVVRDGIGGTFGAFLTDAPRPSPSYFGTGECFLWRAAFLPVSAILASLPPPPSADTTHMVSRSTTLASPPQSPTSPMSPEPSDMSGGNIRFKAFPYSGENDYLMLCGTDYLSVGSGNGKYGLWLDNALETGVSGSCTTFGNENLSEEGEKFEVLGVEVWYVGS